MMILLQAAGIYKSYGAEAVLSNICLQIQDRDRIGLVGVNGAGKTTLLQILCGETAADQGDIHKAKEVKIGYLKQNSTLDTSSTIWDEMLTVFAPLLAIEQQLRELENRLANSGESEQNPTYAQLLQRYDSLSEQFREQGGYEIETKIRAVLHGMGFTESDHPTRINTLSGGQKTRLALASILLQEPDILMLDEPTNHLDIAALDWLEAYLQAYPGAVMVISHDRFFLDRITQTIYEIERTEAKKYTGNYSRFIEIKAQEAEIQLKNYEKQQTQITRMEDFVRRNLARASTTKRAQSRRRALEKMERIDRPAGELKRAHFSFTIERPTGKDVLKAENLAIGYPAQQPLISSLSFEIKRGETVALIGPNGIGKSTLLSTLIGQLPPLAGEIQWGANVEIGYYDQEQTSLNPQNTVLDEVWNAFPSVEEARIRTILGNFLFSGEDVLKKVSALSGGEKARVNLAKLMLQNANVLILDEPTNHLDIYAKEVLEASLLDYEGTILFISHDRYFLNKMAERIVELTPQGALYFLGNYNDAVEKKREQAELEAAEQGQQSIQKTIEKPAVISYEEEKRAKQAERNKQRRSEQLEADIERIEAEISALEQELTLPHIYNNYLLVQEKNEQLEALRSEWQLCYEEWEALLS